MGAALSIEALRARIREIEGARVVTRRAPSGLFEVDGLIDGLPQPGLVELQGAPGSGRTRLALSIVRRQPSAAWLDPTRCLYPPAVQALGVDLRRLLMLHPPADRAIWAVEQVLRAGCFPVVVVSSPPPLRRAGQRWARAAEAGCSTLVAITDHARKDFPADARLQVARERITVVRNRGGILGKSGPLPEWPDKADPWW